MKILFISTSDVHRKFHGGELCTNRNYLSFVELVGEENVTVINLMEVIPHDILSSLKKRVNFISGYYEGLSINKAKEILKLAEKHDIVFINSSTHGKIAQLLKKQGYKGKIITFYHNIEYNIQLEKTKKNILNLENFLIIKKNEYLASKYSDQHIVLNQRDAKELDRIYNVKFPVIIPISLADTYDGSVQGNISENSPTFLFTGNNWYANVHGILWFIENVLDHVDIKLQITGQRMDQILNKLTHPKVEFLGFVENLPDVLKKADFTVLPIFKGSGMKVKTCEALMYGKNIIGTSEAFQGYEIDTNEIELCNTKEEFINAINKACSTPMKKFNQYNRNLYLDKYSFKATLKEFNKILND